MTEELKEGTTKRDDNDGSTRWRRRPRNGLMAGEDLRCQQRLEKTPVGHGFEHQVRSCRKKAGIERFRKKKNKKEWKLVTGRD